MFVSSCVSEVCLIVCFPATLLSSLYLLSVFITRFHFLRLSLFSSIITHYILFHPSIRGEFKTLSSSDMIYPYWSVVWVSCLRNCFFSNYFFGCFPKCNCFFKLSLATTTGVDSNFIFDLTWFSYEDKGKGCRPYL